MAGCVVGRTSLDETTLKIVDVLSRQIGNPISINELKNKIEKVYGRASYAAIHSKIRSLREDQITLSETAGKASITSLNFRNWFTADLLAQTDIWKKMETLRKHPELQILLSDIYVDFANLYFVRSMSIINAAEYLALNTAEFLILIKAPKEKTKECSIEMRRKMHALQSKHNMRINSLILTTDEFIDLLKSDEANPLREMIPKGINFLSPQAFWGEFVIASEKGLRLKFLTKETDPKDIPEQILTYNLWRFGYKEFGTDLKRGMDICIEYVVISILLGGDARRIEAIPVILAKNSVNYNVLAFLSQKYDLSSKLLGLLKTLYKFTPNLPSLKHGIEILESWCRCETHRAR